MILTFVYCETYCPAIRLEGGSVQSYAAVSDGQATSQQKSEPVAPPPERKTEIVEKAVCDYDELSDGQYVTNSPFLIG